MLKIEKYGTMSPEQWEMVIEGTRNPKNSWDLIDSYITHIEDSETLETTDYEFFLGENDHKLLTSLAKGGPVHAKYRRMMPVWVTINAPLYWWKEFDTYKVGTVANSCSTMHKIQEKEFTRDDFSCEHLSDEMVGINALSYIGCDPRISPNILLDVIIDMLNYYRRCFNEDGKHKDDWWQMIQLLLSSYNQKRTILLGYEVLHNMYFSRKDHKLDEWHTLCDWIETLPYSEIITNPVRPIFTYNKETLIDIIEQFKKHGVTLDDIEVKE